MNSRTCFVAGAALAAALVAAVPGQARPKLPELIRQIMRADYEGDRAALDRLYGESAAFLGGTQIESRVRYWKGYAKWRRAMNGANETPTPADLAGDSAVCAEEMHRAAVADPAFVDARVGEMACLGLVLFFDRQKAGNDDRIIRLRELLKDLKVSAADNPRYVWAWGMAYFTAPPERGGGPDNVIKAYLAALDGVKKGSAKPNTPLDPAWGEPELNVNLAYSYLNKPDPDPILARQFLDEALRLAPNWHYAKDILRPQIEKAIQQGAGGPSK
jgi:hypothetical protein